MTEPTLVADPITRLDALRRCAHELRLLTGDPELRWDLINAETVADVVLDRSPNLSEVALQAHVDYLANLLTAIRERISSITDEFSGHADPQAALIR